MADLTGLTPTFIAAGSPEELAALMFKLNTVLARYINFFDIQFVKGKWYAWLYVQDREQATVAKIREIK